MLAIKGAKVFAAEGWLERATVLLDRGKIVSVGAEVAVPEGVEVVDACGKYVTPGLIDAHTHLGILETEAGQGGRDHDEATRPTTPEARALDAAHHKDNAFKYALGGGVTAVGVSPGNTNVIGGQGMVMKTHGRRYEDMILSERAFMKFSLGEPPKRHYGGKDQMPSTRLGIAAVIREALVEAQHDQALRCAGGSESPKRDLGKEALGHVLSGKMPCCFQAQRADDILTALRIMREFSLTGSIVLATEGHLIPEDLARAGFPVIVGHALYGRMSQEQKNSSFETAGVLFGAGLKVAMTTSAPTPPVHHLAMVAGLACREGLPEEDAIRAITINAAQILGVDDRVGSLEAGKDADLVIFDGHPLDLLCRAEATYVSGCRVYEAGDDEANPVF